MKIPDPIKVKRLETIRKMIKDVRDYDNAPDFSGGQPTEAYKARSYLQDELNWLKRKGMIQGDHGPFSKGALKKRLRAIEMKADPSYRGL